MKFNPGILAYKIPPFSLQLMNMPYYVRENRRCIVRKYGRYLYKPASTNSLYIFKYYFGKVFNLLCMFIGVNAFDGRSKHEKLVGLHICARASVAQICIKMKNS